MGKIDRKDFVEILTENMPTWAIPKVQFEARLKADMVDMLTELQLEIEKVPKYCMTHDGTCVYRKAEEYISDVNNLIQQKIDDVLKEDTDGSIH